eukprot:1462870-Amphidinium_carterae.1
MCNDQDSVQRGSLSLCKQIHYVRGISWLTGVVDWGIVFTRVLAQSLAVLHVEMVVMKMGKGASSYDS